MSRIISDIIRSKIAADAIDATAADTHTLEKDTGIGTTLDIYTDDGAGDSSSGNSTSVTSSE